MRSWLPAEVVREDAALVLLSNVCVSVCFYKVFFSLVNVRNLNSYHNVSIFLLLLSLTLTLYNA